MTKDRAIQVLREMKNLTYVATDSRCSALDMAIESLSAEPSKSVKYKSNLLDTTDRQTDESCQDCPLYDTDNHNCPRFNKVIPRTRAELLADRPTLKQTDTMIIADALRYLIKDTERHEIDRTRAEELREQILQYGASLCSSADRPQVNSAEWVEQKEREFEELHRPKVAYICDGRKCDKDCSECFRTLDIEHARDFKLLGDTYYQQESADKFISVVRCKDCKNRVYDESRDYYYCSMYYGQGDVSDNNFCQWGERKGGQDD